MCRNGPFLEGQWRKQSWYWVDICCTNQEKNVDIGSQTVLSYPIILSINYRSRKKIADYYSSFIEYEDWTKNGDVNNQYRVYDKGIVANSKDEKTSVVYIEDDYWISKTAKFCKKLVADGKVTRGYLGVVIDDLKDNLSKLYNHKEGALVLDVANDTPAEKYGLKRGDLIYSINNKTIKNRKDLQNVIASFKPTSIEVLLEA